jgi:hypothetical protein
MLGCVCTVVSGDTRVCLCFPFCAQGPYRTLQDLWDEPQPDLQMLRQQVLARYTNLDKQQPTAQLSSGEWHHPSS